MEGGQISCEHLLNAMRELDLDTRDVEKALEYLQLNTKLAELNEKTRKRSLGALQEMRALIVCHPRVNFVQLGTRASLDDHFCTVITESDFNRRYEQVLKHLSMDGLYEPPLADFATANFKLLSNDRVTMLDKLTVWLSK